MNPRANETVSIALVRVGNRWRLCTDHEMAEAEAESVNGSVYVWSGSLADLLSTGSLEAIKAPQPSIDPRGLFL